MFAVKECGPQQMCVEGILNVAKPSGWTSHDVVAKLRGALKNIRVGHAGTLDPAATGVLPILLGRGTRIAEYLLDGIRVSRRSTFGPNDRYAGCDRDSAD